MFSVEKPVHRSQIRRVLGKEYFCLKEKMNWYLSTNRFASEIKNQPLEFELKTHSSTLLRKLKDVDMQLQCNKITNLHLASQKINGIIIKPGETFSFWKLVGRPTKAKGYLTGMTLQNGKITQGTGGGMCQMGNLIYWMALHTPLTITKRWRHSYDVFPDTNRTIPFGSGATLAYNYIDLQLKNETDQTFQINIWLTEKNLCGSICSDKKPEKTYEVFEKSHRFELQWWGGYTRHNEIWRKIIPSDSENQTEEMITSNHAVMMYSPLISTSEKVNHSFASV